ncbi:LuxR C-terminal-related transcriptional regulator [Arthrobacter sp. TMS2-4]
METEEITELLSAGRAAHARGEWRAAFEALSAADAATPLAVDDLELLGSAAWWSGNVKENCEVSERVFQHHCQDGSLPRAAMKALELALLWVTRGDLAVGSGWISRARRILRDLPESPAHGYLLYLEAVLELDFSGTAPPPSYASRLRTMSERFADPALMSFGLVLSGLADVRSGETARGFAELDEAMLPVLANRIALEWVGDIYCTVIHVCHELADYRRMRSWTAATERWCARFGSEVMYTGVCRVHRLELLSIEGGWHDVEPQIERASADLVDRDTWAAGEGYYQLGEIRRMRGDPDGARSAYALARSCGIEPQPGLALLEGADGDDEAAYAGLLAALQGRDRLARARLLGTAVEAALRLGLGQEAEELCSELEHTAEHYGSAGFRAWAQKARGILLLTSSNPAEALASFQGARRFFEDARARYPSAVIHRWEALAYEALGQPQAAAWNTAAARTIFEELGATAELRPMVARSAPGGLTARELEVLAAITSGASNREVARQLFISEKTVGRHLANIFGKIDVTSRTAAAAWARENGVAPGG